jgi:outer membrane protein assembly factor BamA
MKDPTVGLAADVTARRLIGALGAALTLLLAFGPTPPLAAQASDTVQVVDVDFVGADAFSSAMLATAIVTAPTHCTAVFIVCWFGAGIEREYFDEVEVSRDVLRLRLYYAQRGYRNARVESETTTQKNGVRVVFRIEEGDPVRVASVEVRNGGDIPPDIGRNLPLRENAPFDLIQLEASRDTLTRRLQNRGYAMAEVLAGYDLPQDSLFAEVYYDLYAGAHARFGEIEVTGAQRVSPAVVRRMLTFRPGDEYSRAELLRSQRNLYSQELFRHAEIQQLSGPEAPADSVIPVRVSVNEGDLHRVRAGIGMSSAEYLITEGRWVSRSFLGGARRLEFRAQLSNLLARTLGPAPLFQDVNGIYGRLSGQLAADFTQPWFFSALNTLNAGLFVERRSIPDVFVRTGGGGHVGFRRLVGLNATLDIGFRPELTKLETEEGDLVFCVSFTLCSEDQIRILTEPHWLVPVTAAVAWDRSNSLFSPTRGFIVRLQTEYADAITASDFEYIRLAADLIDYSTIMPRTVLATRISPGIALPLGGDEDLGVHPTRRFFAGGSNSIRGYAQFRLGPKVLAVDAANQLAPPVDSGGAGCTAQQINIGTCDATPLSDRDPQAFKVQPLGGAASFEGSVELRFPLFRDLVRGVAFLDVGQVWKEHTDVNVRDMVATPGFGVRYFSPIGPIRVDVGYNARGAERVQVVTTQVQFCPPDGSDCMPIEPGDEYDYRHLRNTAELRAQEAVAWNPRTSFFRRLQLHFSIGQAF